MADVVESLLLDSLPGDVSTPENGRVWYNDATGQIKFKDGVGIADIRAGGGEQLKVSANDDVAGYLEDKVQNGDGTVIITTVNEGGNEKLQLNTDITETFRAQQIESAVPVSTTTADPSWADAFQGSFIEILPSGDGDYLVMVESDSRCTNSNTDGQLAIGLNSTTTEVAGSVRTFGGNQRGSTVIVKKLTGLVAGDKIHALYNKLPGMGSAELYNRSMSAFRIG